jgi:DNA-binding transcriptional ArsR family regulator
MSLESVGERRRRISDPLAMRALAHPLRLRLHALVGREGSLTAADAARQLGISQALASHHLRQLAKYGYVERGEPGDHRERPWRVTATSNSWEPGSTAEGWESMEMLERVVLDRAATQFADWQQRRADAEPGWAEHTGISQSMVYLTLEEMTELERAWSALIEPLARRRPIGAHDKRPAGAVPVDITLIAAPLRTTESGG